MGPIMTELTPPPGVAQAGVDVSPARLHGEACWICGAVTKGLATAGSVYTTADGEIRIWPVVACQPHQDRTIEGSPAADQWPAAPVPVADCDECQRLDQARETAVREADPDREADERVLLRRHLRLDHANA
jgi:hypothetical protein